MRSFRRQDFVVPLVSEATQRSLRRVEFYEDDRLSVRILNHESDLVIYNLTAFGTLVRTSLDHRIEQGDVVGPMRFFMNHHEIGLIRNAEVRHTFDNNRYRFFGLSFYTNFGRGHQLALRAHERYPIDGQWEAVISAQHPFSFADRVVFKVLNTTSDGLLLKTSLANRLILPELEFSDAELQVPRFGSAKVKFVVKWYAHDEDEEGQIVLGCQVVKRAGDYLNLLVQLALASGRNTLRERLTSVLKSGLRIKNIKPLIHYRPARTEQDFADLGYVRWVAYAHAGKVDKAVSEPESMIDQFDKQSRIILSYLGDDLVGSVRVTFCNSEQSRFELEDEVDITRRNTKENSIENIRLCVIPELMGTDLVHGLIEQAAQLFLKSNRKYLITSCTDELLKFYQRIGYRTIGKSFQIAALGGKVHHLIEISPDQGAKGIRVNPLYWVYTYARVQMYLDKMGYLRLNAWNRLRIGIYNLIFKLLAPRLKKRK